MKDAWHSILPWRSRIWMKPIKKSFRRSWTETRFRHRCHRRRSFTGYHRSTRLTTVPSKRGIFPENRLLRTKVSELHRKNANRYFVFCMHSVSGCSGFEEESKPAFSRFFCKWIPYNQKERGARRLAYIPAL